MLCYMLFKNFSLLDCMDFKFYAAKVVIFLEYNLSIENKDVYKERKLT